MTQGLDALIMGELPDTCGHNAQYFTDRYCFVDCRQGGGKLVISPESYFGIGVKILTTSHNISDGKFGGMTPKNITVEKGAWICSFAILYNCTIGEGAVVSVGSVVANQVVDPYTMVAGNPAMEIARFYGGKWHGV